MYEAIQAVLIVIGAMFIIKGVWNIAKGYNIGKLLSMMIYKIPKYKNRKEELK